MKQSQLKKQLKAESDRFVPDPFDKITAAAKNEIPTAKVQTERASSRRTKTRKRNGLIGVCASLAASAACLAIVLPIALRSVPPEEPTRTVNFSTADTYGLGAVTAARLLGEGASAQSLSHASPFALSYAQKPQGAKGQAENFHRYFTAFDCFLGDEIVTTSTAENTDANYPYALKMTICGTDFNGNAVSYVMYYTETPDREETDEDETERKYLLEGVMAMNGTDYRLTGERSCETDGEETETELKIRAYADGNDKKSYIEMAQEISSENGERETEYVYSVFEEGKLVEETAIEFNTEQKDGKEETSFELEFRNGDAKGKYKAKRETKDGVSEIKVKYKIDGEEGEFRIRKVADGNGKRYDYLFTDGTSVTL